MAIYRTDGREHRRSAAVGVVGTLFSRLVGSLPAFLERTQRHLAEVAT